MDVNTFHNNEKYKILDEIGKSIKAIQQYVVCGPHRIVLTNDSSLVCCLCHLLNSALLHGLRDVYQTFWPVLSELCHSDTLHVIHTLKNVKTFLGKGRAWLYYTLSEGSLLSYIHCLLNDPLLLEKYYTASALVRDASASHQLITLLAGLDHIQFDLLPDTSYLDLMTFYVNFQAMSKKKPAELNSEVRMTSSVTSSLASPVDSGVALLDDDADGTSISEATTNDMDNSENLSLRDFKEDALVQNEIEDNCINDHLLSLEAARVTALDSDVMSSMRAELEIAAKVMDVVCKENDAEYCGVDSCNLHDDGTTRVVPGSHDCTNDTTELEKQNIEQLILTTSDIVTSGELYTSKPSLDVMSQSCISCIETETNCTSENGQSSEIIVRRRQRKNGQNADRKIKRVSFHEDFIKEKPKINSTPRITPSDSIIKSSTAGSRYSWCTEDLPICRVDTETNTNVNFSSYDLSFRKTEEENLKVNCNESMKDTEDVGSKCLPSHKMLPVTERGVPEGQENPSQAPESSWHLCLINNENRIMIGPPHINLRKLSSMSSSFSDLESILSDSSNSSHKSRHCISNSEFNLSKSKVMTQSDLERLKLHPDCRRSLSFADNRNIVYKTSILNRFIKSLSFKKPKKKYPALLKPFPSLYIRGVKSQFDLSQHLPSVDSEVKENGSCVKSKWSHTCPSQLAALFYKNVFCSSDETIYKIFLVQSTYFSDGASEPLIAVLTDKCIYFVGMLKNLKYYTYGTMKYVELDCVIIGPNGQVLLFVNKNHSSQVLVVTAEKRLCEELMSYLEISVRRLVRKQDELPTIRKLSLCDMNTLMCHLRKELALEDDEILCHYNLVHIQDRHITNPSTPLGPTKSGYLMFRPSTSTPLEPWKPGYFILKAGVVYMFADKESRLPCRAIPLKGKFCHGCRRVPNSERPHIFEILIGQRKSFQFAAADEYEASDWLQALVQAASGVYELERVEAAHCTLLVTSQHVIICKESFPPGEHIHILSCASIKDITTLGYVTDQNWCILEFACREVHENVGDWIIYFLSSVEMLTFKICLEEIWSASSETTFPVKTKDLDETLVLRCNNTSKLLSESWDVMLSAV